MTPRNCVKGVPSPLPVWPVVGYEWGVAYDSTPSVVHRGPMTEAEAREWVREWDDMGSPRKGMFIVIRREVGSWGAA